MIEFKNLKELMDYCVRADDYIESYSDWKVFMKSWDIFILKDNK